MRAQVHLGLLRPQDVAVELYVGRVDRNGELVEGTPITMQPSAGPATGIYTYAVETSIARSGLHGFTVRVRPYHPDMPMRFLPGLMTWAGEAKVTAVAS
jgi:starch phosphorylase